MIVVIITLIRGGINQDRYMISLGVLVHCIRKMGGNAGKEWGNFESNEGDRGVEGKVWRRLWQGFNASTES